MTIRDFCYYLIELESRAPGDVPTSVCGKYP